MCMCAFFGDFIKLTDAPNSLSICILKSNLQRLMLDIQINFSQHVFSQTESITTAQVTLKNITDSNLNVHLILYIFH